MAKRRQQIENMSIEFAYMSTYNRNTNIISNKKKKKFGSEIL